MRILNLVFLAAFVVSVAVQFNDPDPLSWILTYGAAAVACVLQLLGRQRWWFPVSIGGVVALWAATLLPGFWGRVTIAELLGAFTMKTVEIELAREAGGLTIIFLWMAVLAIRPAVTARRTDK